MTTALYLRVSSEHQAQKYGLDAQRKACQDYAARAGLEISGEYVDVFTGTAEVRASLTDLLNEASQYQHVLTYAVDRLARNVPTAYAIMAQLREAGLTVHTTQDGIINLDDDGHALKFGINAVFADSERRKLAARTRAGKMARAAAGKPPGNLVAYGYYTDKNSDQIKIHEQQAKIVREIFELAKTQSALVIARHLNKAGHKTLQGRSWHGSTIHTLLTNPIYKGEFHYGGKPGQQTKIRLTIPIPAIVDEVTWRLAQPTPKTSKRNAHGYLLKGRIKCGTCGRTLTPSTKDQIVGGVKKLYRHYRCLSKNNATLEKGCGQSGAKAELIEQYVIGKLREILADPEQFQQAIVQRTVEAVDTSDLDERDRDALIAFRLRALNPQELADIREEIEQERRQRLARVEAPPAAVSELMRVAQTLTPQEMITYLGVQAVLNPDRTVDIYLQV